MYLKIYHLKNKLKFLIQKKLILEGEELLKNPYLKIDEYKRITAVILLLKGNKVSQVSNITKLSKGRIYFHYRNANESGFL